MKSGRLRDRRCKSPAGREMAGGRVRRRAARADGEDGKGKWGRPTRTQQPDRAGRSEESGLDPEQHGQGAPGGLSAEARHLIREKWGEKSMPDALSLRCQLDFQLEILIRHLG